MECAEVSDDSMEEIESSNTVFYIINTLNDEVNGPFSEIEFKMNQEALQTERFSTWIKTTPKPKGAIIPWW